MWIRQIVIHGFKSYAERTEIGEFDQQFNAITGLNGSGKSNILDSICFVLGISNLSQVFENLMSIHPMFPLKFFVLKVSPVSDKGFRIIFNTNCATIDRTEVQR